MTAAWFGANGGRAVGVPVATGEGGHPRSPPVSFGLGVVSYGVSGARPESRAHQP